MNVQFEPSSISTLYFVPDYIEQHMDQLQIQTNEVKSDSLCSRNVQNNQSSINQKSVSDYETMAFVGLRDIIKISDDKLAQLYNYNKREYTTFQAVITNSNINYNNLINHEAFTILYRFFSRIYNKDSWMEISSDLGFIALFTSNHISALYDKIRNLQIRVKDNTQSFELRFFMQLIIYYWYNSNKINLADDLTYFWTESISKIIQFILDITIDRNIEIYCLSTQKWINGKIVNVNKSAYQLYAQLLDGSNTHQWITFFSPRLAPIGFKYFYVPNMTKRNNVPCVVSVVNDQLHAYAIKHVELRKTQSPEVNATDIIPAQQIQTDYTTIHQIDQNNVIPINDWYYKCNNMRVGPIVIGTLFMQCVEKLIDLNTPLYHAKYGFTTLNDLPHIVNAFREHVKKCKNHLESIITQPAQREELSSSNATSTIFTSSSNSSINANNCTNNGFAMHFNNNSTHNNSNVYIPESDIIIYK